MTREALTSERAVEGVADAVVHWLARAAEVQAHAIPVCPVIQRCRSELGAIVAPHDGRESARARTRIAQHPCDVAPAERARHLERDALAAVDVNEREDADVLARRHDVLHAVHRPPLIRSRTVGQYEPPLVLVESPVPARSAVRERAN